MGKPDLVQGGAGRDEEGFVILAPEADVGRLFGHLDGFQRARGMACACKGALS